MKKIFVCFLFVLIIIFGFYKYSVYRQYREITKYVNADFLFYEIHGSKTDDYELAKAVQKGDAKLIKKICKENPLLVKNTFTEKRYSVLHFACEIQNKKAVKSLLEAGINPNAVTENNDTALMYMFLSKYYWPEIEKRSFRNNRKKIVELLIDYGIDCNIAGKNDFGKLYGYQINNSEHYITPLMISSGEGAVDCIELMIQKGKADINAKTENGATSLVCALDNFKFEVARILLCKYHADATEPFSINGQNCRTASLLRGFIFPLNSKKHNMKKEIIQELKNQGIDYYSEPIPDDVLDKIKELYPNTWEEYIKEY